MASDESGFDPAALRRLVNEAIPHVAELGVEVVALERRTATLKLAYQERLVGNPDTGVLHGGVITTLIDTVCGLSVFAALPRMVPIATLDLRIDYLRPASPGKDLLARGHCYRLTRNVAFARAIAFHDEADDPIANAVCAVMTDTAGVPRRKGKPGT